jgi:hypothetical protein
VLGRAKLTLCFQIPSQASLHGILKPHRPFCYANGPALAPRSEIFGRKCGVALGLQAGMCCEKASASGLASVFSATNPAFAQRIKPVICCCAYLSVFIRAIRGLKMLYSLRGSKVKEKYSLNKTTTLLKSSL